MSIEIVYLGSVYREAELLKNPAVSPAAQRWQLGLLTELGKRRKCAYIGHQQERLFPRGRLAPYWDPPSVCHPVVPVRYLNAPVVRSGTLAWAYRNGYENTVRSYGKPDWIVAYNSTPWSCGVARVACGGGDALACCVHADDALTGGWECFSRVNRCFLAHVFLSHWAFENAPVEHKFHIDGGFSEPIGLNSRMPPASRSIAYAGTIGAAKGVERLLQAFEKLADADATLEVFGKPDMADGGQRIVELMRANRRIRYYGVVPERELEQRLSAAAVLVNPVPRVMRGNVFNFPSKLVHYLELGPAVVSEMTAGLSPRYNEVLYCAEPDGSVASLAVAINDALKESDCRRAQRLRTTTKFIAERTWARQTSLLVEWLDARRHEFRARETKGPLLR